MDIKKSILLPTTEQKFDILVSKLVKKFKFPSHEHCGAVVANAIQHMPKDQAYTTLEYLGSCVLKNIAYQVANSKSKIYTHKMQIEQLEALLKSNPNDQQALDALTKAALEGSLFAQETLNKYIPENSSEIQA